MSCILLLSIFSCSKDDNPVVDGTNPENNEVDIKAPFETNPKDTVFSNAVVITYSMDKIVIDNPYQNDGVSIAVNGGDVVVTSTVVDTEINYVLSGSHTDGSFKVYSDYKFGLGLNGVSLIKSDGPAINIQSGKKVSVYLVGETNNRLIDNNIYAPGNGEEDMKATFFSEGQLIFNGNGNLVLKGYNRHAICSDDYIHVGSGNITIQSAYKDGIHVNDYFVMDGGVLDIKSTNDGIECERGYIELNEGKLTINCGGDGVLSTYNETGIDISSHITLATDITVNARGQKSAGIRTKKGKVYVNSGNIDIKTTGIAAKAFKVAGDMEVYGGDVTLTTTGNTFYDKSDEGLSSAAGIKCDENLIIKQGVLSITSSGSGGKGINVDGNLTIDDGELNITTSGEEYKHSSGSAEAKAITSKGNIEINGGNVYGYSATGNAIDANGTLTITDGVIVASGATSSGSGFDCGSNTFKITGGVILGIGGVSSIPAPSVSTQRSVVYEGSGSANQLIHIESNSGAPVLTYKIPQNYKQMTLLFSNPDFAENAGYTIYTGGSVSGGNDFHGLYTGATYTKGTSIQTFTTDLMVTVVGK
ncbi:carbohydrate-binding domain-containing protein [Dysgonomonas sp. 520]|nr:carbohydrate-binding domain-containing protein [Dysgonomonas sp. 520]